MSETFDSGNTGVLARMVSRQPVAKPLGRTAVMKLCYFLQELQDVRLGYDFRLFTYGPFDADVLSDLGDARTAAAVCEKLVTHGRGYGYEITPGPRTKAWSEKLLTTRPDVAAKVDAVVDEFGHLTSGELELRSTIVFVDREFARDGAEADARAVAERVNAVKPHFPVDTILTSIDAMRPYLLTAAGDGIRF